MIALVGADTTILINHSKIMIIVLLYGGEGGSLSRLKMKDNFPLSSPYPRFYPRHLTRMKANKPSACPVKHCIRIVIKCMLIGLLTETTKGTRWHLPPAQKGRLPDPEAEPFDLQ